MPASQSAHITVPAASSCREQFLLTVVAPTVPASQSWRQKLLLHSRCKNSSCFIVVAHKSSCFAVVVRPTVVAHIGSCFTVVAYNSSYFVVQAKAIIAPQSWHNSVPVSRSLRKQLLLHIRCVISSCFTVVARNSSCFTVVTETVPA